MQHLCVCVCMRTPRRCGSSCCLLSSCCLQVAVASVAATKRWVDTNTYTSGGYASTHTHSVRLHTHDCTRLLATSAILVGARTTPKHIVRFITRSHRPDNTTLTTTTSPPHKNSRHSLHFHENPTAGTKHHSMPALLTQPSSHTHTASDASTPKQQQRQQLPAAAASGTPQPSHRRPPYPGRQTLPKTGAA